jgi:hypothetical protein
MKKKLLLEICVDTVSNGLAVLLTGVQRMVFCVSLPAERIARVPAQTETAERIGIKNRCRIMQGNSVYRIVRFGCVQTIKLLQATFSETKTGYMSVYGQTGNYIIIK